MQQPVSGPERRFNGVVFCLKRSFVCADACEGCWHRGQVPQEASRLRDGPVLLLAPATNAPAASPRLSLSLSLSLLPSLSLALALWTANGPGIKPPARPECHQGRCRWARPSAGPWTAERDPRSDCPGRTVANGSWTRALLLSLRRCVVGLYFPLRVRVVCIVVVCNRAEEFLGVWEILALTRDLLNVVSSSHALRG